uniref:Aqueous glue droplet peptide n=1 Tax=Latrodectus hesperus TaxID=256737 RepID=A3R4V4_LATHE|nr:aqueous glue droplet peptide [Latrodectus hesperus]
MYARVLVFVFLAIACLAVAQAAVHHYEVPVRDVDDVHHSAGGGSIFDAAAHLANDIL